MDVLRPAERVERQAVLERAQEVRRAIVAIVGPARLHGLGDQQGADRLGRVRRGVEGHEDQAVVLVRLGRQQRSELLLQPREPIERLS